MDVYRSFVCVHRSLLRVNWSLLCVYRSLFCVRWSLLCVYRSLECAYRSLLCVFCLDPLPTHRTTPRTNSHIDTRTCAHMHTHANTGRVDGTDAINAAAAAAAAVASP